MAKLGLHDFAMSVDGFVAGPDRGLDAPLGVGGTRLHEWGFRTRSARRMIGQEGGKEGVDDDAWREGNEDVGATIMGRDMFGLVRGPWPDESWAGWWGDQPPDHHPVFVLTHHPRPPLEMQGGDLEGVPEGYEVSEIVAARTVAHVRITKK